MHRDKNYKIVTTSWDDGHPLDTKLADILLKHKIAGTFYISQNNKERSVMSEYDMREIYNNFEIGAHSLSHAILDKLNISKIEQEVKKSKQGIEDIIGSSVSMFCYPRGRYNKRVKEVVKNAGFIGARTTREFYLNKGSDPFEMPTTMQAFPLPRIIRIRHEILTRNWVGLRGFISHYNKKKWVEMAIGLFEELLYSGGVWHLWGHSWEIEEYGLWGELETVLRCVEGCDGVMYLTNKESLII